MNTLGFSPVACLTASSGIKNVWVCILNQSIIPSASGINCVAEFFA